MSCENTVFSMYNVFEGSNDLLPIKKKNCKSGQMLHTGSKAECSQQCQSRVMQNESRSLRPGLSGGKKITIRGKDYLSSCFWETSSKHLAGTRESTDTWQGCEKTLQIETTAKGHVQEHRLPATHAGVVAPLKQQIKASSCAAQAALTSFDTIGTTQRGFCNCLAFLSMQFICRGSQENCERMSWKFNLIDVKPFWLCSWSAKLLPLLSSMHYLQFTYVLTFWLFLNIFRGFFCIKWA